MWDSTGYDFLNKGVLLLKRFRYFCEYLFVRLTVILAWLLPVPLLHFFGRCLGTFCYYCVPVRKKLALKSLALAFPEKTRAEHRHIVHGLFRHLGVLLVNHCLFPRMTPEYLSKQVKFKGVEVLRGAISRGRGVVLTGAHFGDWEVGSLALAASGISLSVVTAAIHNPYVDRMIRQHRNHLGMKIIASKGIPIRNILVELKQENCVGLLIDQSAGRTGLLVDFFGRKASTARGPAQFAVKTGAPLILCMSTPQVDGTHLMTFEEIATDIDGLEGEAQLLYITQDVTARIENHIRQNPQFWFGWIHRRWKIRPPKQKK